MVVVKLVVDWWWSLGRALEQSSSHSDLSPATLAFCHSSLSDSLRTTLAITLRSPALGLLMPSYASTIHSHHILLHQSHPHQLTLVLLGRTWNPLSQPVLLRRPASHITSRSHFSGSVANNRHLHLFVQNIFKLQGAGRAGVRYLSRGCQLM